MVILKPPQLVTNSSDAAELLEAFLSSGRSEQAFSELTAQLAPLVYSSASRRTGNRQLAEDVSQRVFTILAQKAGSLRHHPSLIAWVFKTTRFEAANAMRSERHRQRSQEAFAQESIGLPRESLPPDEVAAWNEALPVLDEALDRLNEKDRQIVLERFYQQRTFAEIALRTGKSEAACKMRLKRALEKLAVLLKTRGITLSTTSIVLYLGPELARGAPSTLSLIAPKALAASATFTTSCLILHTIPAMSVTKITLTSTALIILAAAPLLWNQSESKVKPLPVVKHVDADPAPVKEVAPQEVVEVVFRDSLTVLEEIWATNLLKKYGLAHPRMLVMAEALEGLPSEELFAACRGFADEEKRRKLSNFIVAFLGASEPLACLAFASTEPSINQPGLTKIVLKSWMNKSPIDAADWFLEHELDEGPLLGFASLRDELALGLSRSFARHGEIDTAHAFVESLTGSSRQATALKGLLQALEPEELPSPEVVESNDLSGGSELEGALSTFSGDEWATGPKLDPSKAERMKEIIAQATPDQLFAVVQETNDIKKRKLLAQYVVSKLGDTQPLKCFEFIRGEPVDNQPELARSALRAWIKVSPNDATEWFLANELNEESLLGSTKTRDFLSAELSSYRYRNGNLSDALTFINQLTGTNRQAEAVDGIVMRIEGDKLSAFATDLLEQNTHSAVRALAIESVGGRLASVNIDAAKAWASELSTAKAPLRDAAQEGVAKPWLKVDPQAAANWWIANSHAESRSEIYPKIVEVWALTAPNQCGAWLATLPQNKSLDAARAAFAHTIAERDPVSAAAWAESIVDEDLRLALRSKLAVE